MTLLSELCLSFTWLQPAASGLFPTLRVGASVFSCRPKIRKPDVAATPGFRASLTELMAECHKRQWRRGSVFAGRPATDPAPLCSRMQLDHVIIMSGISFSKRPHRPRRWLPVAAVLDVATLAQVRKNFRAALK
jgi:hypothetical protein